MSFRRPLLFATLLGLAVAGATAGASPRAPIPVVLDTDIGTDIDDTWALAQALRSPELKLRLVLTETGDARYRAAIAAKILEAAGRTDVTVGLGLDFSPMGEAERNQDPWLKGYDLAKYPGRVVPDGAGALIDLVMHSSTTVTIIGIGSTPTLAAALKREPRIAARCRFVGMEGSFRVGYGGGPPSAEANVKGDPAALRTVLAAPWQDILLTPLDTCGSVSLTGANYRRVWNAVDDPLVHAVIEGYCVFAPRVAWMRCDFFTERSTTLFDCVAVYLAYSESFVEIQPLAFRVTGAGFTIEDPAGPYHARVALTWRDRPAFERDLARRLVGDRFVRSSSP
jgi:inosine-uridine nucleoside N-ribohydrolase